MTWNEILISVCETFAYAVIALGIPFLFNYVKSNVKNQQVLSLIELAQDTAVSAVAMVNQTFVNDLKAQGGFNLEAQKIAFQKSKDALLGLLNDSMKQAVIEMHGDLDAWIEAQIESIVPALKKE